MTSPISPIGSIGPISSVGATSPAGAASSATGVEGVGGTGGADFTSALGKGLDAVDAAQTNADNLAIQAATGQQIDPAAITVAMTQAQLMTQLVTTVQSKAVTAFNTIMGMQA
jgi:flagellar hook-basal body complex protein FliE